MNYQVFFFLEKKKKKKYGVFSAQIFTWHAKYYKERICSQGVSIFFSFKSKPNISLWKGRQVLSAWRYPFVENSHPTGVGWNMSRLTSYMG